MDQTGTIEALGIRIANDAITIARFQAENAALHAEIARLKEESQD